MEKITLAILKEWDACKEGFRRFGELFPEGADLKTATEGLAADNHLDWAKWLFDHCKEDTRFVEQTRNGFMNSGNRNSGDYNSGYYNSGDYNSGYYNSGYYNSGDYNSGYYNSGDYNSGYYNSGNYNSGNRNSGDCNSGNRNSGDYNSGNRNSGYYNSGNYNSGNRNSGDCNSGHFNTVTPEEILVFNKTCKRSEWDNCQKPDFIFNIQIAYWVSEDEMTDEEKAADPNFYVRGGQTRQRDYKEAWKVAWDAATPEDRKLVEQLPNFDPDVFLEITGIDVRL